MLVTWHGAWSSEHSLNFEATGLCLSRHLCFPISYSTVFFHLFMCTCWIDCLVNKLLLWNWLHKKVVPIYISSFIFTHLLKVRYTVCDVLRNVTGKEEHKGWWISFRGLFSTDSTWQLLAAALAVFVGCCMFFTMWIRHLFSGKSLGRHG